ncbi:MAG: acyl-CoA dehydrogenase family protein, partial [Solirubrobacterales bacterium]
DDEQKEIRRSAREMVASKFSLGRTRELSEAGKFDADGWASVVELGWPGVAVAESDGGAGLGMVALAILSEELGYGLAPVPFAGSAMVAEAIAAAGSESQRERWLAQLAAGDVVGGVVAADGLAVNAAADVFVVLHPDRPQLIERDEAEIEPLATIDLTRSYARVSGKGKPLPGDVAAGFDRARLVLAAELTGIARRAMEIAVAYACEREQFDRPIGSFQAVAHRCADMFLEIESAEVLTYAAAWTAEAEPASLPRAAALAAAKACDAAIQVTGSAIHVHGGIGFTWEADPHLFYRRAQLSAHLLGGARLNYPRAARFGTG